MVDFGEPVGHEQAYRRPAVIVSSDRLNVSRAELVIVVPLTRTRRGLPSHIELAPGVGGLAESSYAKTEDIKSISTHRLVRRLGRAEPANLEEIGRALVLLLELA
jgi:mRNA interferase MazF